MAIEAISGAMYPDSNINKFRSEQRTGDVKLQDPGLGAVGNTNIPVAAKTSGSNEYYSDQDRKQKENPATEDQIMKAINKANNTLKHNRTRAEFSYHDKINRVSIKILDEDTNEVIKEIPPEEALEMIEKMWELAGLFLDEKR